MAQLIHFIDHVEKTLFIKLHQNLFPFKVLLGFTIKSVTKII